MPKSTVSKKKLFRSFSLLKERYIASNYLKNYHTAVIKATKSSGVSKSHLEFMLWSYDLEFWTIEYASDEYGFNKSNIANRIIYPLQKQGYIYKHFERLTPSQTLEDHLFREETKYNYRVRYALTQKARLFVQRFYQSL